MRGFFAIGVERLSKPMNIGTLMRTAHGFGASFFFTVDAHKKLLNIKSDTSKAPGHLPYYRWDSVDDMSLPQGCRLVGVELLDEAIEMPSFRHPLQAAYVLGPERGTLSAPMLSRCDHIVKIPTQFSINVAIAGAIVMYDRSLSLGRFADRPIGTGAPPRPLPPHSHGAPVSRKASR
jgi:tRNA G18 (ribose-2'-O)-methylase SpoU